jgi:hypothetical protein
MKDHDHPDRRVRRTPHGEEVHERKTDFDPIAKIGSFIDRYKVFWFIVVAILGWWTRTILIPLEESARTTREVQMINSKIDSVIVPRLNEADKDRTRLITVSENQARILGVLTRLQCLNLSGIDRAKIDLDCRDIPIALTSQIPRVGERSPE